MLTNLSEQDLGTRYTALIDRMAEDERRRHHDRVRVVVTGINTPDPDERADTFYIQVRATQRLRHLMAEFAARHPLFRDCFTDAPKNFLPQHSPQLYIDESALFEVTGFWGEDDWRDGEIRRDHIEWALGDFVHALSGYRALVSFQE